MTTPEGIPSPSYGNTQGHRQLGTVIEGSLKGGVDVKLRPDVSVEDVKVGQYVVIEGQQYRFFSMVTDVRLAAMNPEITISPPDMSDPFVAEIIAGTATYGIVHAMPSLALPMGGVLGMDTPAAVKTIPPHFAQVREATEADVALIFGEEDERHFSVGNPLDMEAVVCLDIPELVTRSNGVFGKSGTGKTFLTRILLAGMIQKGGSVNLVFDMHNEHGWEGTTEDRAHGMPKGLKQLFPSKVALFTLDEESARRRRAGTDYVVRIGYDEIEPEDIALLREPLSLTDRAMDAVHELAERYGDSNWLANAFGKSPSDLRDDLHERGSEIAIATLRALKTSLRRLERLGFLVDRAPEPAVARILEYLSRPMNVVLEFGRYKDDTIAQVLVANLLSRRIHKRYVEYTEEGLGDRAAGPIPLVITIEEAHKLLNPQVASQTIFGTIARELRKYNVTLLIVDQRPSGIDSEVMSQLGTKLCCLLDNERDVDAVMAGQAGGRELRSVLSKLESKQQALIFGHAVPMPVVIRCRDYGPDFYAKVGGYTEDRGERAQQARRDLYG